MTGGHDENNGWYPDPENPARERFWDGDSWSPSRPCGGVDTEARVDPAWTWLAAFSPLLGVLVAAGYPDAGQWITLVPAIVGVVSCLMDSKQVREAGKGGTWDNLWAILLIPVYLALRARRTRTTIAPAALWVVSLLVLTATVSSV